MILLFDLDDTLLDNPMDIFLPGYLQALSARMAAHADPQQLVRTLLAATNEMIERARPDRRLVENFDAAFYPPLNLKRADVQPSIDAFYAQDFPALRRNVQKRPEAVRVVEDALQRGYRVGIATNPLFPLTAIVQRLEWAGLPVEQYPFALVPSYESFHFAKPNPAYFAEFLGRLGWPQEPVVMIGNDVSLDIAAARQLGAYVEDGKPHRGQAKPKTLPATEAMQLIVHCWLVQVNVIAGIRAGVIPSDVDWHSFLVRAGEAELLATEYRT